VIDDYWHAAINTKTAGFDGVEAHSGDYYPLE
jgi:2,4-dienoyl-CoA reductase-like NADH-dependent reductase (Old Yellow Enzyme family)